MHSAKGCIEQIFLDERRAARISCPPALVPAPGQYLLASATTDPAAVLAQPLFAGSPCPGGFYAAPPLPAHWLPGLELSLRGPLGRGFSLPASARAVALAAFDGLAGRLLALLEPALAQNASVVLLADQPPAGLPAAVEILPLAALPETAPWADYLAVALPRERLPAVLDQLIPGRKSSYTHASTAPGGSTQLLVETPLPCGGLAECGACAVTLRSAHAYKLACKDGPVFDLPPG